MRSRNLVLAVAICAWGLAGCVVVKDGPVAGTVTRWNVKVQEIDESVRVPSSEGLMVVFETSLLFRVLPEEAPTTRKTVGANYIDLIVVAYLRNAVRHVVARYPVRNIYPESGRKEIAAKIREFLRVGLEPRGIDIVDVLLRDVRLPEAFLESIEEHRKFKLRFRDVR